MIQWHPIFAQLLRHVVEDHYEVRTTVPVGDLPREADLLLLRRISMRRPPFRGIWRWLTTWNVLEFKGPSVRPRRGDLELLVELGLGIGRRLNEERQASKRTAAAEISFWYLANRLTPSLLREAGDHLASWGPLGPGLWRGEILGHAVFLVSGVDLPVEEETLPLHVVGVESPAQERTVAEFVANRAGLTTHFGGWLASLHQEAWKEVEIMARARGKELEFDVRPAIEMLGLGRVIEQVGVKAVVKQIGLDRILANLSREERRELKRRLRDSPD